VDVDLGAVLLVLFNELLGFEGLVHDEAVDFEFVVGVEINGHLVLL
jgi:hypothetical protein